MSAATIRLQGDTNHPPSGYSTGRLLLQTLLLAGAGLLGNLAAIQLPTGLHFLLGGVAAMLAARCLGVLPAMLVALAASSWTLVLWHHPFAVPIFVAEAGAVAQMYRRWRLDTLVADTLFWLLAGIPAAYLVYGHALPVNVTGAFLIALKQAANGLVNVILANLLALFACRHLRAVSRRPPSLSLTSVLFNLLAGFALIPGLLVVGIQASQSRDTILDAAAQQLQARALAIQQRFGYRVRDFRNGLEKDLERVLREGMAAGGEGLAAAAVMTRLLRQRPGEALLLWGPDGEEALSPTARDDPALAALLRRATTARGVLDTGLSTDGDVLLGANAESAGGPWRLQAALPLDASLLLGDGFRLGAGDVMETLVDANGDCRIGASGPACFALADMLSDPAFEVQPMRAGLVGLTPTHPGFSSMGRADRTLFLARVPLLIDSPWRLLVAMSARDGVDRLRAQSLRALETLLLVLLCALPVGYLASRWVAALFGRLSQTLDALGPTLAAGRHAGDRVTWPRVGIREIDTLTEHVRTMAEALFRALAEGQASAEDQRVLAERLQVANRGAGIGVWEWYLDSGRLIFDEQMYEVLGMDCNVPPSYEVWLAQMVPEDREPTETELRRCLEGEDTFRTEFRIQHPRHGLRFVLAYAVIFRDGAGCATRLVGLNWDVTEQRLLQAGLIQSSKLATLGEMATAVAHELNQPLNVIGMAAGNLGRRLRSDAPEPAYLAEKVEVIRAQVRRAAAIIDHMRIFGRRAGGQPGPIDVAGAVTAAADLMSEQLRHAHIALHMDCAAGVPPVLGHQVQVEQVMLNLLTNARDALTERATLEGWIHVWVGTADGDVEIRVQDNAGGIAPHSLDRVFEPFFTTKAVGKGTGLGLSVSYGIITDMHGTISVANTVEGAAFTIRLPAAVSGGVA